MTTLRYLPLLLLSFLNTAKAEEPPQAVVLTKVKEASLNPSLKSVGTFKAYADAILKAETPGRVEKINFKDGQAVKAGQVLFVLYNKEQLAKVQKAEAALALGQNILSRKKGLQQKGFAPPQEVEKAEAQGQSDKAELALAQEALQKTIIRAPFEGILSERKQSVGSYVSEGDELVRIQDLTPIRLTFHIPEKDLTAIKVADPVTVRTDAHPDKTFEGIIEAIEPSINEKTRSVTVHAKFENKNEQLLPGLYGRLSIDLSDKKLATLFIPEKALVFRQDATYVYKKIGDKAVLTKITLGARTADQAEVLSGLQKGDEIVLDGLYKIHDGSVIRVSSGT
jgi:membrane fusion protein (multidrug efflux system)